jgi:hypothetical protein
MLHVKRHGNPSSMHGQNHVIMSCQRSCLATASQHVDKVHHLCAQHRRRYSHEIRTTVPAHEFAYNDLRD